VVILKSNIPLHEVKFGTSPVSPYRHESRRGDIQTRTDIESFRRNCFSGVELRSETTCVRTIDRIRVVFIASSYGSARLFFFDLVTRCAHAV
jgi:hypothetical protein